VPRPQTSSASGRAAKASDGRSNATGRAPSTSDTSRLDEAAGFRGAAAASVGGSGVRSAVDQVDAPGAGLAADDLPVELEVGLGAAWAQEARLAADGLLVNREVAPGAARAAQARSS
jgi:hypothetical protein